MTDLEIWLVIILLAVATFLARSSFWLVGHKIILPKRVQEALRYAPACALAAIIVPDLFLRDGTMYFSWENPRLIAGIAATIFFFIKSQHVANDHLWHGGVYRCAFIGVAKVDERYAEIRQCRWFDDNSAMVVTGSLVKCR